MAQYQFSWDCRPGTYSVRETQPDGYFQGGQEAPATGGDDSIDDLISDLTCNPVTPYTKRTSANAAGDHFRLRVPGWRADRHNKYPFDSTSARYATDCRTSMTKPSARCGCSCESLPVVPIDSCASTCRAIYTTEYIEVLTDANGYFEFRGLGREVRITFISSNRSATSTAMDTAGTTGGFSVNKGKTQHLASVPAIDAVADDGCGHRSWLTTGFLMVSVGAKSEFV